MGAGYDIVLVVHVAFASVALGSVVTTGVLALRAVRRGTPDAPVRRYFSPGTNWPERVLVVVPVPGYALVAMSKGVISLGQPWVVAGTLLWAAAVAAAIGWAWPVEQAFQREVQGAVGPGGPQTPGQGSRTSELGRRLCWASAVIAALLLAASVVMVAQPGGRR